VRTALEWDAVHYSSSMQRSIAIFSAEAESVAAGVTAKDMKCIWTLASESKIALDSNSTSLLATNLYIDNIGSIAMSIANRQTIRSKHIDIVLSRWPRLGG
jgi:hypothetical protein